MVPLLAAVVVGVAVGLLRTPLGRHLDLPGVRRLDLLAAGVAGHVLVAVGVPAAGLVLAISLALLATCCAGNRHIAGFGVTAVGLALNAFAVVVHGAMPVRATALVAAGAVEPTGLADIDLGAGRRFEQTTDALPWLGDVIPVEVFGTVASFGDLVVWFGLAAVAGDLARLIRRGQRWS